VNPGSPSAELASCFETFHAVPARDAESFRVPSIPGVPEELMVLGELVEIEVKDGGKSGTFTPDGRCFACYSPKTETLYAIPEDGSIAGAPRLGDEFSRMDGMKAVSVTYRPHEESGKDRADYQHDFEKPLPTLRACAGRALRFAGGGYSVSDWIRQ